MLAAFSAIDWQQPWLAHLKEQALPLLAATDWRDALNKAARQRDLCNQHGHPIHFVPQQQLPSQLAYEAYIDQCGGVPTRDNLHDFFNALIWLHFPQIKRALNALQAAEIIHRQNMPDTKGSRGSQRDAATLFDENAALFICSDPSMIQALRQHDWGTLFIQNRASFGWQSETLLFGHALLEKLVQPYKAITAHAWVAPVEPSWFALEWPQRLQHLDRVLAQQLSDGFTSRELTPLPVLGVPHWWPQQDAGFYADASVFRPMRCHRGAA